MVLIGLMVDAEQLP